MSQPYESAAEITAIFKRMGVPLEVRDTQEKGKHVVATADMKDDSTLPNDDGTKKFNLKYRGDGEPVPSFDLFEESALVSWPTSDLINAIAENRKLVSGNKQSGDARRPRYLVDASNWSLKLLYAKDDDSSSTFPSTTVPSNLFDVLPGETASGTGSSQSATVFYYADETEQQRDVHVAAILGANGAASSLRQFHAELELRTKESIPTSVESIARCVAKAVGAFAQLFLRLSQSGPVVSASGQDFAVVDQLFEASVRGYNRLIEPPLSFDFEAFIKPAEWSQMVRSALRANIEGLLLALHTSCRDGGSGPAIIIEGGVMRLARDAVPKSEADRVLPPWITRVVSGWLSEETLISLLGQITLNAQALVAVAPESGVAAVTNPIEDGNAAVPSLVTMDNVHKRVPIFGAGLFTLQSNFNHSCAPNACVSSPAPQGLGGHDIIVRAYTNAPAIDSSGNCDAPVTVCKAGEELCITYIPELYLACEGFAKRRERLSAYFFQCACPKCTEEESVMTSKNAV